MPKIGRNEELREEAKHADPSERFIDFGVRLRVLNDDATPGRLLRQVLGGRWDAWKERWVTPQPEDLDCVEWTIQEQQIPVLLETPRDVLFVAIFAGRQAGKTHVGFQDIALDAARSPGRRFGIVIQNFDALEEFKDAMDALLPKSWGVRWIGSRKRYVFPHGAVIVFRSMRAINTLRGPSLKRILLEEAALMPFRAFSTAAGCGMAAKGFRLSLVTTPKREIAWLRDVDATWDHVDPEKAHQHKPKHRIYRLRTEDNPRRNRDMVEAIRADLPADLVAEEFEGRLQSPRDQVWCTFTRAKNVRPVPDIGVVDVTRAFTAERWISHCKPEQGADFIVGWSFRVEAAVIIKVFRRTSDGLLLPWIMAEAVSDRTTTERHAVVVYELMGTANAVIITDAEGLIDRADGRGRSQSGITELEAAEVGGTHFRLVMPHGSKNPETDVLARTVNRLWNGTKHGPRLHAVPGKASSLVEVMETQRMGQNGKPIEEAKHSIGKALGFFAIAGFPIEPERDPNVHRTIVTPRSYR